MVSAEGRGCSYSLFNYMFCGGSGSECTETVSSHDMTTILDLLFARLNPPNSNSNPNLE